MLQAGAPLLDLPAQATFTVEGEILCEIDFER